MRTKSILSLLVFTTLTSAAWANPPKKGPGDPSNKSTQTTTGSMMSSLMSSSPQVRALTISDVQKALKDSEELTALSKAFGIQFVTDLIFVVGPELAAKVTKELVDSILKNALSEEDKKKLFDKMKSQIENSNEVLDKLPSNLKEKVADALKSAGLDASRADQVTAIFVAIHAFTVLGTEDTLRDLKQMDALIHAIASVKYDRLYENEGTRKQALRMALTDYILEIGKRAGIFSAETTALPEVTSAASTAEESWTDRVTQPSVAALLKEAGIDPEKLAKALDALKTSQNGTKLDINDDLAAVLKKLGYTDDDIEKLRKYDPDMSDSATAELALLDSDIVFRLTVYLSGGLFVDTALLGSAHTAWAHAVLSVAAIKHLMSKNFAKEDIKAAMKILTNLNLTFIHLKQSSDKARIHFKEGTNYSLWMPLFDSLANDTWSCPEALAELSNFLTQLIE